MGVNFQKQQLHTADIGTSRNADMYDNPILSKSDQKAQNAARETLKEPAESSKLLDKIKISFLDGQGAFAALYKQVLLIFVSLLGSGKAASGAEAKYSAIDKEPIKLPENAGTLATHFAGEGKEALEKYLSVLGPKSKVTIQEAIDYMDKGEKLAEGIGKGELSKMSSDPKEAQEQLRAICWFIMAKAGQDAQFVKSGSLRFPDADQKMFDFLNSSPEKYLRVSTHFNERSLSDKASFSNVGLTGLAPGKKAQPGIEDYDRRLPGQGGAVVFDKLQDGTTFLKLESGGMPEIFRSQSTARETIDHILKASGRVLEHSLSFIITRFETKSHGADDAQYTAKEHVPKRILKDFKHTVKILKETGLVSSKEAKSMVKTAKVGLKSIQDLNGKLAERMSTKIAHTEHSDELEKLRQAQSLLSKTNAGIDSLMHKNAEVGIADRKGEEVHVRVF